MQTSESDQECLERNSELFGNVFIKFCILTCLYVQYCVLLHCLLLNFVLYTTKYVNVQNKVNFQRMTIFQRRLGGLIVFSLI